MGCRMIMIIIIIIIIILYGIDTAKDNYCNESSSM
jgi:hypothetical protein